MNVSSQTPIVGEIVPRVVWILVNGDGVAVPVPVHYIWPISGYNLKVITVEPESLTVAALDMEYMTRPETEPELAVGEWMVDVRNVLMLDPLFPFYARPGGRGDRAPVRGCAAALRRSALWFATASLRPCPFLWRSAAGLRSRLRAATCRTMLRKVLPSSFGSLFCVTALLRGIVAGATTNASVAPGRAAAMSATTLIEAYRR